jgi:hypothetical protein
MKAFERPSKRERPEWETSSDKREPLSEERSDEFRFAPRDGEPFSEHFDSLEFLLLFAQAKSRVENTNVFSSANSKKVRLS